ncbi:class I SAM-dependent methyltransferase [Reichenbachiella sp.]|uniref:class I SAM-dependent methyltransferase n=1 Tax=Reichenbachiella sp. TaxID=2184521 RepID=UPI003BAF5797
MDIKNISEDLILSDSGIWEAPKSDVISYTENGHELIKDCEEGSFWFKHRQDSISFLTAHYEISSLLDVGGGNGRLSSHLQKRGIECTLLEPGKQAIINAQSSGLQCLICSSLNEAKFKDNSWEAVGIFDVLEHIESDEAFLQEIHRILKPGGRLFLTVPAYQSLFSDFDREVGHFRRYTLADLRNKLNAIGFNINYKTYLFSVLPVPIVILRLLFKKRQADKQIKRNKEHFKDRAFIHRVMSFILSPEKWLVKWRWLIPFGSSCLVVAQKKTENIDE